MPTSYTSGVQEGKITELKDYVLMCARNFGALIHMREVDNYHLNQLNRIIKDYEEFLKLTDAEIQSKLDKYYERRIKEQRDGLKRFEEGKQRCLDMLEKVKSWNPPTKEHIKLKEFAVEQLERSLEFDYSDRSKAYYLEKPFKDTVEEYRKCKEKDYFGDIEYHSKAHKEEIERVDECNKWIRDLMDSL